ncbi:MAG: dihydroxyacetone kinase transcriptional activator DhaS [Vagococcus sp.]
MVSNGSLITKKVIAYSFKDLMKTKDFQKISIKDIMSHADYRRQTFYDHFSDKYDLLSWIYNQEITENIEHFINYEHWTNIIPRILTYFQKNKDFYQQTLRLTEQQSFDQYFVRHTQHFIITILESEQSCLPKTNNHQTIEDIAKFYAFGLSGLVTEWVFNDCDTPIDELELFLVTVIESSILKDYKKIH